MLWIAPWCLTLPVSSLLSLPPHLIPTVLRTQQAVVGSEWCAFLLYLHVLLAFLPVKLEITDNYSQWSTFYRKQEREIKLELKEYFIDHIINPSSWTDQFLFLLVLSQTLVTQNWNCHNLYFRTHYYDRSYRRHFSLPFFLVGLLIIISGSSGLGLTTQHEN